MFYITKKIFDSLKSIYNVSPIDNKQYNMPFEKHQIDLCYQVSNNTIIGYIYVFSLETSDFYVFDIVDESIDNLLNLFCNFESKILEKNDLFKLISYEKKFSYFDKDIEKFLEWCDMSFKSCSVVVNCDICKVSVWSKEKINNNILDEYLCILPKKDESINYNIYVCDDFEKMNCLKQIFNTIEFMYKIRIYCKPEIISEGNGYVFFQTEMYIIGKKKYYNYIDSSYVYYVINLKNNSIYIFGTISVEKDAFRAAHALFAFSNISKGGINLHASALSINNNAIILIGEKKSGKTTNLLFGLKLNKNSKILSNDIVHIYSNTSDIFAIGSYRKMTIRNNTIALFDELKSNNKSYSSTYDSIASTEKNNVQLVRTIANISKMFNRSVQKIAKVHILAFIEYKKGLKNICIEKIEKKDLELIIKKNTHQYYDGREPFWNDIYKCKNSTKELKNIIAIRVSFSEYNYQATWEYLYSITKNTYNRIDSNETSFSINSPTNGI